jgi:hypothetical protein
MRQVKIIRVESGSDGTFSAVLIDNKVFCFGLELNWHDNKNDISHIPVGKYHCKVVDTSHLGRVYQVCEVPQRMGIFIHSANVQSELRGCIALGHGISSDIDGKRGIINSRLAVIDFHEYLDQQDFELEICEL